MTKPPKKAPHILIVDDEPLARNRLQKLCVRIDETAKLETAGGGLEALDVIAETSPDIILLDIDMPGISGVDVARKCQALAAAPQIIFTTAHSKYAVEAFRLNAADYLLKPVKQALLSEALARAKERLSKSGKQGLADPESIWVQDSGGAILISCGDIEYIEADRDYMRIFLGDQSFWVHETLTSLQERLPELLFVRINRSIIVRKDLIREIRRKARRTYAVLTCGSEHNIGPVFLETVAKLLPVQAGGSGLSETVTE